MKIRAQILAATVVVSTPLTAAYVGWDAVHRQRGADDFLAHVLQSELGRDGAAERCAADPAAFAASHGPPRPPGHRPPGPPGGLGPPPPRPELWTWDASGHPGDVGGPALPDLGDAVVGEVVVRSTDRPGGRLVAARTGWGGACEVVAVTGGGGPGHPLVPAYVWIAPLAIVAAVMGLAVEPVVRRVRRLTEAVRARDPALGSLRDGGDEVAELAAAFEDAARELQREAAERAAREEALRTFVANTTHDLMTPLTVLLGHLSDLRARGSGDPEVVGRAVEEAHYIGALFRNLSAASRLDGGSSAREPTDLGALVERVVARHRPLAVPAGLTLDHAVPVGGAVVRGDLTLLEQAVGNLVYNAIRYHSPSGHVAVVVDTADGRFELKVIDDGPGLSDDALQAIGLRGFRTDEARTRAPEGQGLGLAIVRRVADLHGMQLSFARSEYGGLEVTLAGPVG